VLGVNEITTEESSQEALKEEKKCHEEEMLLQSQLCKEVEEEECGLCHDMFMKECHINMEPRNRPVKMRVCQEVKADVTDCRDGYRRECRKRYSTECGTTWKYRDMEEDRPVCGVEMVGRCTGDAEDDSEKTCTEVPVMKCKIVRTKVQKRLPETSCRRVPRSFCRKKKCKTSKRSCYYKVSMISELTPVESCSYSPKRVCQESEEGKCRTVKKQVCQPVSGPPTVVKKKICQMEQQESNEVDEEKENLLKI